MLRTPTTTTLQAGDLLRLKEPIRPGVNDAYPTLKVCIVAFEVLRIVGEDVHLYGAGVFVQSLEEIEAKIESGEWEHVRPEHGAK